VAAPVSSGKKRHEEEHENEERWLVTYADMITLLMAFFIMMYAMSTVNMGKFEALAVSVRTGFGGEATPIFSTGFPTHPKAMPTVMPTSAVSLMATISGTLQKTLQKDDFKDLDFSTDNGAVIIRVRSDDVMFARGSDQLTPKARRTIEAVAKVVAPLPHQVRIEGHTCDLPVRSGKYANNWELSSARAISVVLHMIGNCDFSPNRLSAMGYSDTLPVVPNNSEAHRIKNRRIDIVLTRGDTPHRGSATAAGGGAVDPDVRPGPVNVVPNLDVRLMPHGKAGASHQ
jgi:chemotaxis protein MotB